MLFSGSKQSSKIKGGISFVKVKGVKPTADAVKGKGPDCS
jgi:hypothetical protein